MTKSKINILCISHDAGLYGAQRSLLDFMRTIDRDRFKPYVVLPYKGELSEELKNIGISVDYRKLVHWVPPVISCKRGHIFKFIKDIRARVWGICGLVERYKIDVIYTNTVTVIEGALAAKISNVPHVWHLREHVERNQELKIYIPPFVYYKVVGKLSHSIIVNSNSLKRAVDRYVGSNKSIRVYNGVELQQITKDYSIDKTILKDYGVKGEKIIIHIGALHPRKGIGFLIDIVQEIKDRNQSVLVMVVGEGDESFVSAIKNRIKKQKLNAYFIFVGQLRYIFPLLTAADILLLTSKQEPFGRVVIEAMSASKPVVVTRSGGPEEIVIDAKTGYVRDYGDTNGFADAIEDLLSNSDKAESFGKAGAIRVAKEFDLNTQTKKLQSIIENAAS